MGLMECNFLIICLLFFESYALNCRSDGGMKQKELKNIYMNCMKRQNGNSSDSRNGFPGDQDWRDRRQNQRFNWDTNEDRDRLGTGNDRMGYGNSRLGYNNDRMGNGNGMGNNNEEMGRDMNRREGMTGSNKDRMKNSESRDRMESRDYKTGNQDGYKYNGNSRVSGRDDFLKSEEFGRDTQYNSFGSNQHKRFKREKKKEMNSGHRSQYSPNSSQRSRDYFRDDKNSSDNSSKSVDRACALHCFLEELEMVGDNGMPDRYLVSHAITKDVKNEDLKDFLLESIEECFQILYNENAADKCEFSKNLMMCLSEKGKANCDDWRDDIQF